MAVGEISGRDVLAAAGVQCDRVDDLGYGRRALER
jgi:hypothetical protein